ncbi:MAG: ABC transporter permease [Deltaproteobacteria bacterium]|nr:ABC transporter permease [Deltaproteobacteria bacterium]
MDNKRNSIGEKISGIFKKASNSINPLFGRNTLADFGNLSDEKVQGNILISSFLMRTGQSAILLYKTLSMMFTAKTDKGDNVKMAYRFTNGSLVFVVTAMAFVGMIMVYQSTEQLSRSVGDTSLVGASFLKLLVRVLGPTVIGLMIACRVGAGIAAEIAAMAVTEQLDAQRMCAADPVEVLMVPRLRGAVIAAFSLTVIGSGAAVFSGMLTGLVWFNMPPSTYFNFSLVTITDLIQGLVKAFAYGVAVPIVSGAWGLSAFGGARGVGEATTGAVVGSSFVIVVLDSLISLMAYLLERL